LTRPAIVISAALAACSAGNSDQSTFHSSANGYGKGGAGPIGAGGSGSPVFDTDAGGQEESCAALSVTGETWPLDMYIMMDQSGSMASTFGLGFKTKWMAVTQGLTAFFNSQPDSVDLGLGIQFFPQYAKNWNAFKACPKNNECGSGETCVGVGSNYQFCMKNCASAADCVDGDECIETSGPTICSNDVCDPARYAQPEVDMGIFSGNKPLVLNAMKNHVPINSTPTGPAMEGAIQYARIWAGEHPGRKTIVVLATDGQPTECPGTGQPGAGIEKAKQLASEGASSSPPVMTFVIGTIDPGDLQGLTACNEIAQAGGTGQALIMKQNQPLDQQFSDALAAIKGTAVGCEFKLPTAQGTLDFNRVNVVFNLNGGPDTTIYHVEDASQCDATEGGWYYDVKPTEGTPSSIKVCSASCEKLQASGQQVNVNIQMGCKTQNMPK
jgi:hypothetical protein